MNRTPYPSFRCSEKFTSSQRPYVIHPYYTGRDKGALTDGEGNLLLFMNQGRAWRYVFEHAQPNDDRAADNYMVRSLPEYLGNGYIEYALEHGYQDYNRPSYGELTELLDK